VKRLQRVSQGGATLVVSLIMLTLITLMILAALAIGLANFRNRQQHAVP
jgi:Tfp pilus assembly protein PilX